MTTSGGATLVAYLHPNEVTHSFHDSIMRLVSYDATQGGGSVIASGGPLMMRCGTGGLVEARNKVMAHFLDESQADWLFMIDADMGFRPDTVDRLLAAADPDERPVVGGLCFAVREVVSDGLQGFKVRPVPTLYNFARLADGEIGFTPQRRYAKNALVKVAGTGAACMLVHRSAAAKVRAEYGDVWFNPVTYQNGKPVGEDLSFCYRLGSVGLPIHVHTGVHTNHYKSMWFGEAEYELFDRAFRDQAAAGRVSVLLPTRRRPESLRASITSLRERATYPDLLDILVAVDPDDPESVEVAKDLGISKIWVTDERFGYAELHRYYNGLAEAAEGEWLLLWNDDASMLTDRWDEVLANLGDEVLVADLQSQHSPRLVCFPAVRSRAVDAVGAYSPHTPHCDTYWQQIGRETRRMAAVPIHVHHDRQDLTGGHDDETWREGQAGYQTTEFFSPPIQTAIREDAAKIRRLA